MPHENSVPWDEAIRARLGEFPKATDADIADALNAETVPGRMHPVQIADAVAYLRMQGAWRKIVTAKDENDGAWAAVDLAGDMRQTTIRFDSPIVTAMLDVLQGAGILSTEHREGLLALGVSPIPWWQSIGAPTPLNEFDIARAREGA